jgi:hypothetical protein
VETHESAVFAGPDVEGPGKAGVPIVELNQDASQKFDNHHCVDDTLGKVDVSDPNRNFAAWAPVGQADPGVAGATVRAPN